MPVSLSDPLEFRPEQVQRYLPLKLYNELILNPDREIAQQCVEHLSALLQTVQTYCSSPILAEAQLDPHNVQGKWCEATLTIGTYFQALNPDLDGDAQSRVDRPIQPRLVDEVSANVRGVVFEGGRYTTPSPFDPVVTRLGDSYEPLGDETLITGTQWIPSQLISLSQLETLAGTQKSVVVLPGQYRGQDELERVHEQVAVSLYASTLSDWQAPMVVGVTHTVSGPRVGITVAATDDTGVCRTVVAYTDGKGEWKSLDLVPSGGDTWEATLQATGAVAYFVQVVDEAGNVAVDDNGGIYYETDTGAQVYLPVVVRNLNSLP